MERRPTVMVADLDGPVLQVVHGEQFLPGGWSAPAAVTETHSGVVFFVGDRAYKLKKPLDLGFLDFRMREARLAACQRELVLNRRPAPDVYLGVADVSGPDGTLLDHLLVMRRMPERPAVVVAGGRRCAGARPPRSPGRPSGPVPS
jgi:aminoglycoside phosphotransferase family enzyme